ncbi:MAG: hypothetical protein JRN26_03950 [Nitrososphaerota archaeon]|jgi:hypothetical protein|nr:hypothetical protein [Nitrososphaerota archaeon]
MKFTVIYSEIMQATAPQTKETSIFSLIEKTTTYDNVKVNEVIGSGKTTAPVIPVVMDRKFIEQNRNSLMFLDRKNAVDSKGKPLEADTWYKVNREARVLEKITKKEAGKLEWHERFYVHESALRAIEERRPALYISGYGLELIGYYYDWHAKYKKLETKQSVRVLVADLEVMLRELKETLAAGQSKEQILQKALDDQKAENEKTAEKIPRVEALVQESKALEDDDAKLSERRKALEAKAVELIRN